MVGKDIEGAYESIESALKASRSGDYIYIYPGSYDERIVIDHDVRLIGQGELGEVLLTSNKATVIEVRTNLLLVENITVSQLGRIDAFAVDIQLGMARFSSCDFSSNGLACVVANGNSSPTIVDCTIHDGNDAGILIQGNSRAVVDGNKVLSLIHI